MPGNGKVKEKRIYGKKDVTDRGLVHSFPGLTPEQFQEHSCGYGYISCWNRSIPFHPGPRLRVTIVIPQPTTVIKTTFLFAVVTQHNKLYLLSGRSCLAIRVSSSLPSETQMAYL